MVPRAYSINERPQNVEKALEDDPAQPHSLVKLLVAVKGDSMHYRHDTRNPQANEHESAVGSPS